MCCCTEELLKAPIGLADATSFIAAFFRGSMEEDKGNAVDIEGSLGVLVSDGRPLIFSDVTISLD